MTFINPATGQERATPPTEGTLPDGATVSGMILVVGCIFLNWWMLVMPLLRLWVTGCSGMARVGILGR